MRRTSIERNGAMEKSESGKFDDTGIVLQDNSRGAGRLGQPGFRSNPCNSWNRRDRRRSGTWPEVRVVTRRGHPVYKFYMPPDAIYTSPPSPLWSSTIRSILTHCPFPPTTRSSLPCHFITISLQWIVNVSRFRFYSAPLDGFPSQIFTSPKRFQNLDLCSTIFAAKVQLIRLG